MKESKVRPIVVAVLILAGILVGLQINKRLSKGLVNVEGGSKFDEVMWYVGNDYVDTPDTHELEEEAIAAMMEKLDIPMPEAGMAVNVDEAIEVAERIGYPVMVRPSYVLGGSAWRRIPSRWSMSSREARRKKWASWLATASFMLTTP